MKLYKVIRVYPRGYENTNLSTLENMLNSGYKIERAEQMNGTCRSGHSETYKDYILVKELQNG